MCDGLHDVSTVHACDMCPLWHDYINLINVSVNRTGNSKGLKTLKMYLVIFKSMTHCYQLRSP